MRRGLLMLVIIGLVSFAIYNNMSGHEGEKNNGINSGAQAASQSPSTDTPQNQDNVQAKPEVGFQAPAISLLGLDGKTYSLAEVNKPVVINFWASWCEPCRLEAPEMVKLYDKYKDNVALYAINITEQDEVSKAEEFAKEYEFTFPVLLDPKGDVSSAYQIQAIPTTYFIDQNGIIVDKILGLAPPSRWESTINKMTDSK